MSLHLNTATEGAHNFEVVLSDFGTISRDKGTIIAGQNLVTGSVLGKITASGKYTLHDNAAIDGSEVAAAVLLTSVDATDGDKPGLILSRLAEVKTGLLIFKSGISAPNKAAALVALAAKNIIAR